SQTGRCAANLRTMAQAVLAYSADDGGKVPPAMAPATPEESGGAGHRLWIDYLRPYLPPLAGSERQHPYLCPAARRPGLWNNTCPDYGCNLRWSDAENAGAFALQSWNPEPHPAEIRIARVQNPSQLIMFADSYASNSIYTTGRWGLDLRSITNGTSGAQLLASGLAPRHQVRGQTGLGKFNAAFFDGHVESISVDWRIRKSGAAGSASNNGRAQAGATPRKACFFLKPVPLPSFVLHRHGVGVKNRTFPHMPIGKKNRHGVG
ncbi:MAG: hypothetical protein EBU15_14820, partial [Betaproteobacteria bacterium]|nr:hypothetical protein [Betaproteobacteria bacterium]